MFLEDSRDHQSRRGKPKNAQNWVLSPDFRFFSQIFGKLGFGGPESVMEHRESVPRLTQGLHGSWEVQRTSNFECATAME